MKRVIRLIGIGLFVVVVNLAVDLVQHRASAGPVATMNGDVNGDGGINVADPVYLLNWLFAQGPLPVAIAGPPVLTAEQQEILGHMSIVYLTDGMGGMSKTLRIEGVNVQLVNGAGSTDTMNGLGNLILGYNENTSPERDRTGSHNLNVGIGNAYPSAGCLVAGVFHSVEGLYSVAVGGADSEVYSSRGSAIGGYNHVVNGMDATCIGGVGGMASGFLATTCGGSYCEASGTSATTTGGEMNIATGELSTATGGFQRIATGTHDWVAGQLFQDQ